MQSIPTWANHWFNGFVGFVQTIPTWANHWVNGFVGFVQTIPTWANHWVNGSMGWVGASHGYVSKQTRVSKGPHSRIENR